MRDELAELKELLSDKNSDLIPHIASDLGIRRYINSADRIKRYLPNGKILDWGCGLGQMTYLLKNRGFDVVSYDIDQCGRDFLARIGQTLVLAEDQSKLPFPDASFDALLSSGVFEHVADQASSLKEVSRVLKKNGYFFVFMLPNKYSYIEFISDRLGRGDHPVKYIRQGIKKQLEQAGYEILYINYKGFLPYNLKGFPGMLRRFYHRFDGLWEKIDAFMVACPIINKLSTNIELVARKK